MGKYNAKLTSKEAKFCEVYVDTGSASEAYRAAYNAEKMRDTTIWARASELCKKSKVAVRIAEIQAQLRAEGHYTKQQILQKHAEFIEVTIADFYDGWGELKDWDDLTEAQKAAVKSIDVKYNKQGDREVKIELHDKQRSLEAVTRMQGYNAPEEVKDVSDKVRTINVVYKGEDVTIDNNFINGSD